MLNARWLNAEHTIAAWDNGDGTAGSGPASVPEVAAHIDADGELAAYEPPVPDVPSSISDRQFFQQLALNGVITQTQALAAVKTGAIPPALQGFVDGDAGQKFSANMLLSGATIFERNHPLTEAIGAAQGMTPEQINEFFRAAAQL